MYGSLDILSAMNIGIWPVFFMTLLNSWRILISFLLYCLFLLSTMSGVLARDLIFFINYGVLRTKKYLVGFTDIEKRLLVAKEEGVWGRNELGVCG